VQIEPEGRLGRGHPIACGAGEEVDLTAGRVAERGGDRGDRGRKLRRTEGSLTHTNSLGGMPLSEADVIDALRPVQDPELHRSIVDLDMVRNVEIDLPTVSVLVALTIPGCPHDRRGA